MSSSIETKNGVLLGKEDEYGGVTVDMPVNMKEPPKPNSFAELLRASLSQWKQDGKRGVWIKLPKGLSNLVHVTVEEGFDYHHAEKDYLMLVKWLPGPAVPSTLPANASHTVGIGAFVLNDKNQVLVVQEKDGQFQGTGVWKLITGVVNQGENFCDGAIREVKEETGIDTKFVEVLSFYQSHNNFCGKSDMFFACMLEPVSCEIKKQESEITDAKWMDIEEYINQDYNKKYDSFRIVAEICRAKAKGKYSGISAFPIKFYDSSIYLYCNGKDLKF